MGFPSCDIFSPSLSHARMEFEQLVIAGCGGSAEEVAKVAFRRVAYNLHWLRQQAAENRLGPEMKDRYSQLVEDVSYVHMRMEKPSALCNAFRAHAGWITLFIDLAFHMLEMNRPSMQLGLFIVSMHAIMIQTSKVQPYFGNPELLETPFLDFITRAGLMISNFPTQLQPTEKSFNDYCIALLDNLASFCIYRPILSRINRGLKVPAISTIMNRSDIPIAAALLDLRFKIDPLLQAYETYKRSPPPIFCCGSRQCDSTDHQGALYRCSGCKLALYCSVACQKRDWCGPHKTLCSAMNKNAESAASIPLSSPDLRWLAYLFMVHFFHQDSPRVRSPASAISHTTLIAVNYLSRARFIEISKAGPFVPDGIIGEAWHMCLGFRKARHSALQSTHTMAVSALVCSKDGETAKITALLTYPIAEEIVPADVRATWIYRD